METTDTMNIVDEIRDKYPQAFAELESWYGSTDFVKFLPFKPEAHFTAENYFIVMPFGFQSGVLIEYVKQNVENDVVMPSILLHGAILQNFGYREEQLSKKEE